MKLFITFYRTTHLWTICQTHLHAAMILPLAFCTFNDLKHGAAKIVLANIVLADG